MFPIGLSSCGKILNEALFRAYRESGISHMEISPKTEAYDTLDYKSIAAWAKEYGVTLWSFHLPFLPFDRLELSKNSLNKATAAYFKELIAKASDIGIAHFVVHPSGEPIEDTERAERMKCAKNTLAELAEAAKPYGAVIAVEDLPRTCLGRDSSDIRELISLHDGLRVCFDTNHLLNEKIVDFVKAVGDKIITTHISDYDFVNERHWLPGEGKIDWQELAGALESVNYNGPWLYEIGFTCPDTILRDRDLTCADFARNAKEIFENRPLSVFSKPKPNLGFWS